MRNIYLNFQENKRYLVKIGVSLFELGLSDWSKWLGLAKNTRICLVSNSKLKSLYAEKLKLNLTQIGYEVHLVIIPDGESYKTLESSKIIFDALMNNRFNRNSSIIALGGGVIGDLAGFVASTFMRGVNLIQIPTSLLAQVDSSVGGKTAVNHPLGKNMIGTFYQPSVVLIDPNLLNTLEKREFLSGFAEVIKYGLIMDTSFFNWLYKNADALKKKDNLLLTSAIHSSCASKAKIVEQDEKEEGLRALLNLGHSFAHAIETSLGYGSWLHGEAVALGMFWASEFSFELGHLTQKEVNKIKATLEVFELPTKLNQAIDLATFIQCFLYDKKFETNKIRLILLKNIGEAYIEETIKIKQLETFLKERLNLN